MQDKTTEVNKEFTLINIFFHFVLNICRILRNIRKSHTHTHTYIYIYIYTGGAIIGQHKISL